MHLMYLCQLLAGELYLRWRCELEKAHVTKGMSQIGAEGQLHGMALLQCALSSLQCASLVLSYSA